MGLEDLRNRVEGRQVVRLALLIVAACGACVAQTVLPDAPLPQTAMVAAAADAAEGGGQETFPPAATRRPLSFPMPGLDPSYVPVPEHCRVHSCSELHPHLDCCQPTGGRFQAYLKENAEHLYTPRDLAALAWHGVADPFNLLTIAYTSALSVATDPDSPFGPGMKGFGKLAGVTLTQDMTGEFVGTFLIPSLDHQDPHYHRLPNASLKRRIAHCVYQVFWTQTDTGEGVVNYSTLVGVPVDEAVANAYVPYRQVGWGPSAERVGTDWATAPIGNFVTEFVPDVARRINVHVVLLQRIINRVAIEEGGGPAGP